MGRHSAREVWAAAKHPRGFHGRFGSGSGKRVVSENGAAPKRATAEHSKRALFGNTVPSAITASYRPRASGQKRSVTKYEPGIYGGKDARLKYQWSHGWEVVGHEPRPEGSTFAALQQSKERKAAGRKARRKWAR